MPHYAVKTRNDGNCLFDTATCGVLEFIKQSNINTLAKQARYDEFLTLWGERYKQKQPQLSEIPLSEENRAKLWKTIAHFSQNNPKSIFYENFSPLMRKLAIKTLQEKYDTTSFFQATWETVLNEFNNFVSGRETVGPEFGRLQFIRDLFNHLATGNYAQLTPSLQLENLDKLSAEDVLNIWWQTHGFNEYCQEMAQDKVWGGNFEWQAISAYFGINIGCFQDQTLVARYAAYDKFDTSLLGPEESQTLIQQLIDWEILDKNLQNSAEYVFNLNESEKKLQRLRALAMESKIEIGLREKFTLILTQYEQCLAKNANTFNLVAQRVNDNHWQYITQTAELFPHKAQTKQSKRKAFNNKESLIGFANDYSSIYVCFAQALKSLLDKKELSGALPERLKNVLDNLYNKNQTKRISFATYEDLAKFLLELNKKQLNTISFLEDSLKKVRVPTLTDPHPHALIANLADDLNFNYSITSIKNAEPTPIPCSKKGSPVNRNRPSIFIIEKIQPSTQSKEHPYEFGTANIAITNYQNQMLKKASAQSSSQMTDLKGTTTKLTNKTQQIPAKKSSLFGSFVNGLTSLFTGNTQSDLTSSTEAYSTSAVEPEPADLGSTLTSSIEFDIDHNEAIALTEEEQNFAAVLSKAFAVRVQVLVKKQKDFQGNLPQALQEVLPETITSWEALAQNPEAITAVILNKLKEEKQDAQELNTELKIEDFALEISRLFGISLVVVDAEPTPIANLETDQDGIVLKRAAANAQWEYDPSQTWSDFQPKPIKTEDDEQLELLEAQVENGEEIHDEPTTEEQDLKSLEETIQNEATTSIDPVVQTESIISRQSTPVSEEKPALDESSFEHEAQKTATAEQVKPLITESVEVVSSSTTSVEEKQDPTVSEIPKLRTEERMETETDDLENDHTLSARSPEQETIAPPIEPVKAIETFVSQPEIMQEPNPVEPMVHYSEILENATVVHQDVVERSTNMSSPQREATESEILASEDVSKQELKPQPPQFPESRDTMDPIIVQSISELESTTSQQQTLPGHERDSSSKVDEPPVSTDVEQPKSMQQEKPVAQPLEGSSEPEPLVSAEVVDLLLQNPSSNIKTPEIVKPLEFAPMVTSTVDHGLKFNEFFNSLGQQATPSNRNELLFYTEALKGKVNELQLPKVAGTDLTAINSELRKIVLAFESIVVTYRDSEGKADSEFVQQINAIRELLVTQLNQVPVQHTDNGYNEFNRYHNYFKMPASKVAAKTETWFSYSKFEGFILTPPVDEKSFSFEATIVSTPQLKEDSLPEPSTHELEVEQSEPQNIIQEHELRDIGRLEKAVAEFEELTIWPEDFEDVNDTIEHIINYHNTLTTNYKKQPQSYSTGFAEKMDAVLVSLATKLASSQTNLGADERPLTQEQTLEYQRFGDFCNYLADNASRLKDNLQNWQSYHDFAKLGIILPVQLQPSVLSSTIFEDKPIDLQEFESRYQQTLANERNLVALINSFLQTSIDDSTTTETLKAAVAKFEEQFRYLLEEVRTALQELEPKDQRFLQIKQAYLQIALSIENSLATLPMIVSMKQQALDQRLKQIEIQYTACKQNTGAILDNLKAHTHKTSVDLSSLSYGECEGLIKEAQDLREKLGTQKEKLAEFQAKLNPIQDPAVRVYIDTLNQDLQQIESGQNTIEQRLIELQISHNIAKFNLEYLRHYNQFAATPVNPLTLNGIERWVELLQRQIGVLQADINKILTTQASVLSESSRQQCQSFSKRLQEQLKNIQLLAAEKKRDLLQLLGNSVTEKFNVLSQKITNLQTLMAWPTDDFASFNQQIGAIITEHNQLVAEYSAHGQPHDFPVYIDSLRQALAISLLTSWNNLLNADNRPSGDLNTEPEFSQFTQYVGYIQDPISALTNNADWHSIDRVSTRYTAPLNPVSTTVQTIVQTPTITPPSTTSNNFMAVEQLNQLYQDITREWQILNNQINDYNRQVIIVPATDIAYIETQWRTLSSALHSLRSRAAVNIPNANEFDNLRQSFAQLDHDMVQAGEQLNEVYQEKQNALQNRRAAILNHVNALINTTAGINTTVQTHLVEPAGNNFNSLRLDDYPRLIQAAGSLQNQLANHRNKVEPYLNQIRLITDPAVSPNIAHLQHSLNDINNLQAQMKLRFKELEIQQEVAKFNNQFLTAYNAFLNQPVTQAQTLADLNQIGVDLHNQLRPIWTKVNELLNQRTELTEDQQQRSQNFMAHIQPYTAQNINQAVADKQRQLQELFVNDTQTQVNAIRQRLITLGNNVKAYIDTTIMATTDADLQAKKLVLIPDLDALQRDIQAQLGLLNQYTEPSFLQARGNVNTAYNQHLHQIREFKLAIESRIFIQKLPIDFLRAHFENNLAYQTWVSQLSPQDRQQLNSCIKAIFNAIPEAARSKFKEAIFEAQEGKFNVLGEILANNVGLKTAFTNHAVLLNDFNQKWQPDAIFDNYKTSTFAKACSSKNAMTFFRANAEVNRLLDANANENIVDGVVNAITEAYQQRKVDHLLNNANYEDYLQDTPQNRLQKTRFTRAKGTLTADALKAKTFEEVAQEELSKEVKIKGPGSNP